MQTRKRVLINAFTVRALRDTFAPARGAGIKTPIVLSNLTSLCKFVVLGMIPCFKFSFLLF